ncbi:hypothetical protein [Streptomyces sp. CdTB01]|uniref:hypothetical protein n=1 Tax=Streptomyces sp. CdTB01 TaxID=1725411 RepID=UPI00099E49CE|nr:hypothetical protein [Streptomyces sp. CdTB01]
MSPRGRRAALPGQRGRTTHGLLEGLIVRVFAEDGSDSSDYPFAGLPVAPGLRQGLAEAFSRRTAPGAGLTSLESVDKPYRAIRAFTRYLSTLAWPPTEIGHLLPEHLDGFLDHRKNTVVRAGDEVAQLKLVLKHLPGLSEPMIAKLGEANPRRPKPDREDAKKSYSRKEFKRIADAARADLRAAAARIRKNRADLDRYRRGEAGPDTDRRLELLDWVDRFGDVPRYSYGDTSPAQFWVKKHGPVTATASWLHLSTMEVIAGAVLLTAMTGQNKSVIIKTPAVHHRADGHTGNTKTAILETHKPRRQRRAHMTLALSELPDWISIPGDPDQISARDELHTPFGLYALLHELTSRSREIIGSSRLLVCYHGSGGNGVGRGLRPHDNAAWVVPTWARGHSLMTDERDKEGNPVPLNVTFDLLRLTYVEFHQAPVAHTEQTLATDYLARNRGNLTEYQKVVAKALKEEVDKARTRGVMATLTKQDLERAQGDPETVAAEFGIPPKTLKDMIDGKLDTVMNACVDHRGGPHAAPGEPCRASFMLCLGCPCARALPQHLPVQVLVHDRLLERRDEMTPLQWAERFALPHDQLASLLDQHDEVDVSDARTNATDDDRAVVTRFLNRELDLR